VKGFFDSSHHGEKHRHEVANQRQLSRIVKQRGRSVASAEVQDVPSSLAARSESLVAFFFQKEGPGLTSLITNGMRIEYFFEERTPNAHCASTDSCATAD